MTTLDQVLEKIKNQKSLTKEEVEIAYGKEQIEIQEQQFQESYVELTPKEQEAYYQEAFKEEIATTKRIKELEENDTNIVLKRLECLESKFLQNTAPTQEKTNKNDILSGDLEKYFEGYLEHKKEYDNISDSSLKSYKASYKYLNYFIDKDTIMNFSFFKEVQKKLQQLPKNFFKYKKYYEKDFNEVIKLRKKEKYETLDPKTINNHINNFKNFFVFLVYEEVIKVNPLLNIKPLLESKEIKKEEYSEEELTNIFNSDLDVDFLNMCKLSLYTGLRIEEVLSLKKQDINDDLIYVDLKDTSTKKHQRVIPIHKNLLDTINQQKKHNKGSYLFFNGNIDNEVKNIGKRINRRLKSIISSENKTFHSFRKNFSQEIELKTNAEDKIKKYLMGHSMSRDVTHMVYNRGKMNTEKLKDCINQITFNF